MNLIRVGVGRKLLGGLLLRSGSIRPRLLVTTTMIGGRQRATPEDVVDLTGEEDVDRPADKRARTRTHPPRSSCLDTSLPFQLFRTRGIPAEYNVEQQGLGFDMEKAVAGEIKFAFVSVRHRSVPSRRRSSLTLDVRLNLRPPELSHRPDLPRVDVPRPAFLRYRRRGARNEGPQPA